MAKILIIEDEEALLVTLAEKLRREGHEVNTAKDGEEGLAKLKESKPDLVLLDIIMPKVSGMEVLEAMHADKELSKIPVVIISNSGQPVEIEKAKLLGARDYLIKAEFDPEEVLEKVNSILAGGSSVQEADAEDPEAAALGEPRPGREVVVNNAPAAVKSNKDTNKSKGDQNEDSGSLVLVVEDDQFLRDLIVKKLEEEGLKTIQAIDGEEGLRLARENKPNLILLDLILPGIDGFEVLKQVKADSSISAIPIIILSNLGQKDDIDKGIKLGAKDYLIKAHFTPGEIVQKAREVLEEK